MTERRRRFLLVSGFALVTSSVLGLAVSPRPRPVLRAAADDPGAHPGTGADDNADDCGGTGHAAGADDCGGTGHAAGDDCGGTATTLPAPTTTVEAAEPAAPSVVYAANAECDPATGETTVSWKVTNNGEAPVTITGEHRGRAARTEPGPPVGRGNRDTRSSKARQPISR